MEFLANNRKVINFFVSMSCIIDVIIGFIINVLSQQPFNLWRKENVIITIILIILILSLIICNIVINNHANGVKPKKLQRAFQKNGGYDVVATEIKNCIRDGNVKRLKSLKKMVKIIEE